MPKRSWLASERRFFADGSARLLMAVFVRIAAAGKAVNRLIEVDGAGSSLGPIAAV
jgi:hypothetical protein